MKSLVLLSAVCLQIGWSYARGEQSCGGRGTGREAGRTRVAYIAALVTRERPAPRPVPRPPHDGPVKPPSSNDCMHTGTNGVGAFSYLDSSGNRYGGTYGLKDGEVVNAKGEFPPDFAPPDFAPRNDFSNPDFEETDGFFPDSGFFPEYFRNLENLLHDPWFEHYPPPPYIQPIPPPSFNRPQSIFTPFPFGGIFKPFDFQQFQLNMNRAFQANLENQRLAMNAAYKAFDLTSNRAGSVPNLNPSRLTPFRDIEFPAMPIPPQFPKGFPFSGPMPGFDKSASSSSFAAASAGPGVNHHVAVISPGNPFSPNVDEMNAGSGKLGGFKEVSVSSFSSSTNIDGKQQTKQEANTYINDNGKVTAYSVHNP